TPRSRLCPRPGSILAKRESLPRRGGRPCRAPALESDSSSPRCHPLGPSFLLFSDCNALPVSDVRRALDDHRVAGRQATNDFGISAHGVSHGNGAAFGAIFLQQEHNLLAVILPNGALRDQDSSRRVAGTLRRMLFLTQKGHLDAHVRKNA